MYTELKHLFETGIYKITCLYNSKIYIGSAVGIGKSLSRTGFYRRWKEHISKLEQNKHRNYYLQNSWNKYGKESFKFEIIELCTKENSIEKENYWINYYKSYDNNIGFNIIKNNLSNYNQFSEEHKQKISQALLGKPRSPDLKEKLGIKVIQYDLQMKEINRFYSISEASRITNIQRQDIGQVCSGNNKTAGGYIWKKVKDIV